MSNKHVNKRKIKKSVASKRINIIFLIVYLGIPFGVIRIFYGVSYYMIKKMSYINIGLGKIQNSDYYINNILTPFFHSLCLILGCIVSYVIVRSISKKLSEKYIFEWAKQSLRFIEILVVFMTITLAVYNKDIQFNYDEYGVSKTQLEQSNSEYVSLEKIQTIRSNGLEKQEDYINNIFVKFSRLMSKASGEVELIIAVLGGIIVPLKKYCDGE